MAQRNLDLGDVALVLRFGRRLHRAGACFHFLAAKDLPHGAARSLARLVGTTVVTAGRCILTVYRNPLALRRIKRKSKHWPRAEQHSSDGCGTTC
jgi:hypothetical protein